MKYALVLFYFSIKLEEFTLFYYSILLMSFDHK
jgi:hypothetical protein